ncbi:MAG: 1-acyl-sn-glycerol-3-phosphate acyltransferase [Crocinitomicaceae bacterium]|nr:1-acyl-sn-glycerol-3-phosphate acyltransferase [Crocinitomicaceae bacterium]
MGWTIEPLPEKAKKCVMIMAPHTSNFDFYIGILGFWSLGAEAKMLIKKEAFKPGIGFILKKLGGIPVDRHKKTNLTEKIAEYFDQEDEVIILFTPEGTRSLNENWKKGFYYLSKSANVPIVLAYMDYKRKVGGFLDDFEPTWNEEEDFKKIKELYLSKGIVAKHPEMTDVSASS